MYYTYTDNQGSLIALTDASGNVVRKYAYDPWGARRNASDWTQKDNGSNLIVNRGYTGHEHLDAFGIINMNGRAYDPATGMFLSPDPFIQSPGDWVNYNRYSYCMSNPMRYTDPSGYVWDGVGADGMTNEQWINNYWYQKALKDRSDGAMYEMARAMEQVQKDRQEMANAANRYLPNGLNPSDVAVHFGGIDAVDVGRSLKNGYGMVIESLRGTDYAVFSKGSFDFVQHADGNMTPSDPSAYFMTASIWDHSNGGRNSKGGGGTETAGYFNDVIGNFGSGMSKLSGTFRLTDGSYNGSNLSVNYYSSGWNGGSRAGISTYSAAKWGGRIGKGSILVSVGLGAYNIYNGIQKDGGTYGLNAQVATGQTIGGIGGGMAGAEIGAAIGVWFGGVGVIPGAIIGGVIGGWAGSEAGEATVLEIR